MTQHVEIFQFEQHEIRTIMINDEPWFVAGDVCRILLHSNTTQALRQHVESDEVTRQTLILREGSKVVSRLRPLVNESGVYALIFGSKLPNARVFRKWVTAEVLPSIRRTGGYIDPSATDHQLAELKIKIQDLENQNRELEVRFESRLGFAISPYSISDAMRELGCSEDDIQKHRMRIGLLVRDEYHSVTGRYPMEKTYSSRGGATYHSNAYLGQDSELIKRVVRRGLPIG